MSTFLVTGGAGFVGAYVTRALLSSGHRIVVYDLQPNQNTLDLLVRDPQDGRLLVERGEITDSWKLLRACGENDVEGIVHLASPLTQDLTDNPTAGVRDVCLGTSTVFEVARQLSMRRVVWTSSVAVFGAVEEYPDGTVSDDAHHRPSTVYGSAKSLCESLAVRAWEQDQVDSVGLRLSLVYGAGRLRGYMSYPSHVLRDVALDRQVHVQFGDQHLHWQYVEEVAAMICTALMAPHLARGMTYNTCGEPAAWREVVAAVQQLVPESRLSAGHGEDPELRGTAWKFDATPFVEQFEYAPSWPLPRGVAASLKHYADMRADHNHGVDIT